MRYLTHQFATLKPLNVPGAGWFTRGSTRAQIHATIDGIPRIAVLVAPGQAAEAGLIIDAAELTDPEGLPSFWDLARQPHVYHDHHAETEPVPGELESKTFVVGYQVPDERSDLVTSVTAIEMRDAYFDR